MEDKKLEELMEKNSAFEISYTKKVTVPWEDIDDIVCTMIECGGSSYWCTFDFTDEKFQKYDDDDTPWSEIATLVLMEGGSIVVIDDYEKKKMELTVDKLLSGLKTYLEKFPKHPNLLVDDTLLDSGYIDSVAADIILQLSIFGEVVYG